MTNITLTSNNKRTFMIKYLNKIHKNKKKVPTNMSPNHKLKQFFAPAKYSKVMIDALNIESPKKVIDLAIGGGALLIEFESKFINYIYNNIQNLVKEEKSTIVGNSLSLVANHLFNKEN